MAKRKPFGMSKAEIRAMERELNNLGGAPMPVAKLVDGQLR